MKRWWFSNPISASTRQCVDQVKTMLWNGDGSPTQSVYQHRQYVDQVRTTVRNSDVSPTQSVYQHRQYIDQVRTTVRNSDVSPTQSVYQHRQYIDQVRTTLMKLWWFFNPISVSTGTICRSGKNHCYETLMVLQPNQCINPTICRSSKNHCYETLIRARSENNTDSQSFLCVLVFLTKFAVFKTAQVNTTLLIQSVLFTWHVLAFCALCLITLLFVLCLCFINKVGQASNRSVSVSRSLTPLTPKIFASRNTLYINGLTREFNYLIIMKNFTMLTPCGVVHKVSTARNAHYLLKT